MKRNLFILLSVFAICIGLTACNSPSSQNADTPKDAANTFDLEKTKATIRDNADKFTADFKKGDSTALASYYASDALAMPPNSEPVKVEQMASLWGGAMRMGVKDVKFDITDITGNEQLLVETGKYEMYGNSNNLLDKGKYVVAWKQENGNWKIYRDIWNTSMPPAPPAPAK